MDGALEAGLLLVGLTIHDPPKLGAEPSSEPQSRGSRSDGPLWSHRTLARLQRWSHVYCRVSGGGSLENGREALSHCWPTRAGLMRSRSANGVQGGSGERYRD